MSTRISVRLVDDHELFRRGIRLLLEKSGTFQVSEAANGEELIEHIQSGGEVEDIYLIDFNMPLMNGVETARWLRQHCPDSHLVCFSMYDSDEHTKRMLEAGCCTAINKAIDPYQLIRLLTRLKNTGSPVGKWWEIN